LFEVNNSIRFLAGTCKEAILKNEDGEFANKTSEMLMLSCLIARQLHVDLHSIITSTCFSMFENEISREHLADLFYTEATKACAKYLN